ncbi:glycosyltransferase [Chloroflexota bacterium]
MPLSVSIVVPVLNGAAIIRDLLTALVNQRGCPHGFEIIVVDNGSVDRTQEIVRQFEVTLLEESRRGPGPARNRGLYHASGEIIAHLDADTIPTRRWLAEITTPFSNPEVVLVAGHSIPYKPATPAQHFIAQRGSLIADLVTRETIPFAPSLNMAVRRQAALDIGGWTEDMLTAEDIDFSYRLLKVYPSNIIFNPLAVVYHQARNTDQDLRTQAWTYGEGLAQFKYKHPESFQFGVRERLRLYILLIERGFSPGLTRLNMLIGRAGEKELSFMKYLRKWSFWYWGGFFSYLKHQQRREP